MTREIKFRILNKIDKTLQQGNWIRFLQNEKTLQVAPYEIDEVDPADCIIMQYTGLKDKNGKEIYESDLVKRDLDGDVGKVEMDEGVFTMSGDCQLPLFQETVEIIGNIYENPDLLK